MFWRPLPPPVGRDQGRFRPSGGASQPPEAVFCYRELSVAFFLGHLVACLSHLGSCLGLKFRFRFLGANTNTQSHGAGRMLYSPQPSSPSPAQTRATATTVSPIGAVAMRDCERCVWNSGSFAVRAPPPYLCGHPIVVESQAAAGSASPHPVGKPPRF